MKSVLISIQPKWCEKIANGEKTIEVRKTIPKLEMPFKCYIYATRPKKWFKFSSFGYASDENLWLSNGKVKMCDGFEFWADGIKYESLCGKVIGEFICNDIEKLEEHIEEGGLYYTLNSDFNEAAQLDNWQLHDYGKGKPLYGWHISDLKIYDTPKELREFSRPCSYSGLCFSCKRASFNEDGNLLCNTEITRLSQSWLYVEE